MVSAAVLYISNCRHDWFSHTIAGKKLFLFGDDIRNFFGTVCKSEEGGAEAERDAALPGAEKTSTGTYSREDRWRAWWVAAVVGGEDDESWDRVPLEVCAERVELFERRGL